MPLDEVEPEALPPVASDQRKAWRGSFPDSQTPLRIEAAAWQRQAVWFAVSGPVPADNQGPMGMALDATYLRFVFGLTLLFGIVMYAVVFALLARNLKQRRGDTRGALRLAVAVFVASTLALLLRADHRGGLIQEAGFLITIVGQAFYFSAVIWASYLAMEPFARRLWPEPLISWSRLLAGQWRDPLVGRDLLFGILAGAFLVVLAHLEVLVGELLNGAPSTPLSLAVTPYNGSRHLFFLLGNSLYFCIELPLCALFLRYLARRMWRHEALTWVLMIGFLFFPLMLFLFPISATLGSSFPWVAGIVALVWVLLLWRVGLLAAVVCLWTAYALLAAPLTPHLDRWYADTALIVPAVLCALLLFGFHTALAGKSWLTIGLVDAER